MLRRLDLGGFVALHWLSCRRRRLFDRPDDVSMATRGWLDKPGTTLRTGGCGRDGEHGRGGTAIEGGRRWQAARWWVAAVGAAAPAARRGGGPRGGHAVHAEDRGRPALVRPARGGGHHRLRPGRPPDGPND
jgi:hypothetical protein